MSNIFLSSVIFGLAILSNGAAQAAPPNKNIASDIELRELMAPIQNRSDVEEFANNASPTNPLNQLSVESKKALLDSIVYNNEGRIASLAIDEIKRELSPSDAYKLLALFGYESVAREINNGMVRNPVDEYILTHPLACPPFTPQGCPGKTGYYCNPGEGCIAVEGHLCSAKNCK